MVACEQTQGQNVLQHGERVHVFYCDLVNHLTKGSPLRHQWRLPEWLTVDLLGYLHDEAVIRLYQVYHDCGKPYCLEIDEEGRRHFPEHALVSERVAREVGFPDVVCRLIGRDMEIHTLKDAGVEMFMAGGTQDAVTLLLTGLCEIHANASMFGGVESVSFKQKWKQLNKRGKKIVTAFL